MKFSIYKLQFTIIYLFLIFLSIPIQGAFAQDQNTKQSIKQLLNVSPFIIDTQLKKGQNNFSIQVKNLLDQPLGISANGEDFNPESNIVNPNLLVNWTQIKTKEIILNPNETKQIDFVINVPQNAKDSGFSEFIFLTPIFIKTQNPAAPTVLERVGVLVLANLGKVNYNDLAKKTNIEDFNFSEVFYEKLPIIASFSVKNNYFGHFNAKPILTFTPLFGKSETYIYEDKHILPGQIRSWSEIINPASKSMFYNARLAISIGAGRQIFAHSFFFVFPIRPVLITMVAILAIVLILFRRKEIKKALQILIKG